MLVIYFIANFDYISSKACLCWKMQMCFSSNCYFDLNSNCNSHLNFSLDWKMHLKFSFNYKMMNSDNSLIAELLVMMTLISSEIILQKVVTIFLVFYLITIKIIVVVI